MRSIKIFIKSFNNIHHKLYGLKIKKFINEIVILFKLGTFFKKYLGFKFLFSHLKLFKLNHKKIIK